MKDSIFDKIFSVFYDIDRWILGKTSNLDEIICQMTHVLRFFL